MTDTKKVPSSPNRCVGSIEYVGDDGFIVTSVDPDDPAFHGGKRLFQNFDELLRFLAEHLQVYKKPGNMFGIRPEQSEEAASAQDPTEGNGVRVRRRQLRPWGTVPSQQQASEVG